MNLSPTAKHYLISVGSGALLAAGAAAAANLSSGAPFSWPLLGAAVIGGVVLFGRDWLHNNSGAFLEGTAPSVAAALVTGPPVAIPVVPVTVTIPH